MDNRVIDELQAVLSQAKNNVLGEPHVFSYSDEYFCIAPHRGTMLIVNKERRNAIAGLKLNHERTTLTVRIRRNSRYRRYMRTFFRRLARDNPNVRYIIIMSDTMNQHTTYIRENLYFARPRVVAGQPQPIVPDLRRWTTESVIGAATISWGEENDESTQETVDSHITETNIPTNPETLTEEQLQGYLAEIYAIQHQGESPEVSDGEQE